MMAPVSYLSVIKNEIKQNKTSLINKFTEEDEKDDELRGKGYPAALLIGNTGSLPGETAIPLEL